jgi:ribosome recycling factor
MTINDFREKAQKAVDHYQETLKTIRTGRATPALIENLPVDAYGAKMPLFQVATIGAPEPRLLTLSVWDKGLVDYVVKAIKDSDLGVNPQVEATLIRLNLPMMTEERRKELTKVVGKYAEDTRIVLRNVRREYLDDLKKREKEDKIPEGEVKAEEEKVDVEVKKYNELVEQISDTKQKELMAF